MSLKKIRQRLEDLYLNKPKELKELLDPKPKPCDAPSNLETHYPSFLEWLTKIDTSEKPHIEEELKANRDHALRRAVEKYKKRKEHYEVDVNKALGKLARYEVGVAVLAQIHRSGKTGRFFPFVPDMTAEKPDINADVWSDDSAASTSCGMPIYDDKGRASGSGTGKGSNVNIDYSADQWGVFSNAPQGVVVHRGTALESDEILLHELVHAGRQMNGLDYSFRVSGGYDNEEEYLAVVIANVYLSNKTKTVLRASHRWKGVLADPDRFLDSKVSNMDPRTLLERLYLNQRSLYDALAKIPERRTAFNPVRTYEKEQVRLGHHKP